MCKLRESAEPWTTFGENHVLAKQNLISQAREDAFGLRGTRSMELRRSVSGPRLRSSDAETLQRQTSDGERAAGGAVWRFQFFYSACHPAVSSRSNLGKAYKMAKYRSVSRYR